MGNDPGQDEEAIFYQALALTSPTARAAYVKEACGNDRDLFERVQALLTVDGMEDGFLEDPPTILDIPAPSQVLTEAPGTVIGRYKLLERIGEGGMAVVYMAEQTEPIRRKVALKIIKLGMDTRQVIARFEAERQALALMDHPSIAKVLDAGATETGRPYFVMELVTGVSVTEYCDTNSLSTKDRLGLFLQVCHAVQHAHQKGIIHRDIKPSNVMVTHHDGKPVPKVIDFGIAKATNQKLTEKTLFTRYAHIIGTPAYMSPEQAELSDLDIDTRSDIYSLGVLLYELLTGTTPFSEEELRQAGYIEMQRVIREQEPVKPSTKLSTLGGTLTDIAKRRNSTPDLLCKGIRGDLDWIVMKSLEKDRARRYETAGGLAEDIRRHLACEPVVARGPSTTYRLRKFLRRHRAQTIAALAVVLLAGAAVVVLSLWNRDRLQLAEAQGFRDRGILSQAREQYAKADREGALETIRPVLTSKHVGPEARLLQATILVDNRRSDEAATILNRLLNDRPEVAGAAHSLLARILWETGSPDAAKLQQIEEHRRQAEALLPDTAQAYFLRAMTAVTIKEQFAALDRALQLDPMHYESRRLRAFTYYASRKYDRLRDDALVMTVLRPRDPLGYSLRAVAWRELGHYREAMADYDVALALMPPGDPQRADLSVQRCETLRRMGEYPRVLAEAQECSKLAPDKPVFRYYIFCALTALGEYDTATTLFREIIRPSHEARRQFQDWCAKYVFDTLEAKRSWHPPDREPAGPAFLPMVEAEETYRNLSAKAHRLTTGGFSARWSPEGKKLAFSLGVQGSSGVAVFDPATKETELLIVPGKDPRWSPDGKHIAFVRDRHNLRLEELVTPERGKQQPPMADEEVWVMDSDGTAPRRLAQGSWPSWGSDSDHIYYRSRGDGILCLLSLARQDGEPKQIMKCSNPLPSVSADNRQIAYFDGGSLTIKDLASQKIVAECRMPSLTWGVTGWSPTGNEVCLGGGTAERDNIGLWLYDLQSKDFLGVLDGPIAATCWSPGATDLAFCLGTPYLEIWSVPLDPNAPTAEALGPSQTIGEHLREMAAFYTRRIEADSNDAYAYSSRARYHDRLGDRGSANADMRQWSTILSQGLPRNPSADMASNSRRVISISPDYEFVFSAERPANTIPMMSVAFGQKGRCEMRLFRVPMFAAALLGFYVVSGLDAPPARANFTFGEPVNLGPTMNSSVSDTADCISPDGREMYLTSDRSGGYGSWDIWVSSRSTTNDRWGTPVDLGPTINTDQPDFLAYISPDGLELYFTSYKRPGGYGGDDIWVARRMTKHDPWGQPTNLGPVVNSSANDWSPSISPDGLELYFSSARSGGYGSVDLWVTRRATTSDPWVVPENLGPVVCSPASEGFCFLSSDGLALFFSEDKNQPLRPGGYGDADMWLTRRASVSDSWSIPVNLGPMANTSSYDGAPRISPDGSTLYFCSERHGGFGGAYGDIYQAPIIPIVDFNGDGQVDGKDLLIMVVQLGGNDSMCDVGPYAWGDGVVDAKDLTVLAEHIGKEVEDPTLVAHWAFDETEGTVAYDSAGDNDATVVAGATWQPQGGMVGGALQCDGMTGCVLTGRLADLGTGPFSVIAWVKGGAPGQIILCQGGTTDWLLANPTDGSLMTKLTSAKQPLAQGYSEAVITDGKWHRIALVWDGADRILYADGLEVARDAQPEIAVPVGSLMIGAGTKPGTFWTGLIDDVRIYNRIVRP